MQGFIGFNYKHNTQLKTCVAKLIAFVTQSAGKELSLGDLRHKFVDMKVTKLSIFNQT